MKDLYIFSGLGADERIFKHLDFEGFNPVFIKWIQPLPNEPIEVYVERLLPQILSPNPVLIGVSFGGIIAIEIAKQIGVEKVVLISSVKSRDELPFYFRSTGKLNLHKLLPYTWLKRPTAIGNWFFGIKSEQDRKLLAEILHDTDLGFLKWAINQIVKWKNYTAIPSIIHIHGESDRILPFRNIKANFSIRQGGHFMTVNKSEEVNTVIRNVL